MDEAACHNPQVAGQLAVSTPHCNAWAALLLYLCQWLVPNDNSPHADSRAPALRSTKGLLAPLIPHPPTDNVMSGPMLAAKHARMNTQLVPGPVLLLAPLPPPPAPARLRRGDRSGRVCWRGPAPALLRGRLLSCGHRRKHDRVRAARIQSCAERRTMAHHGCRRHQQRQPMPQPYAPRCPPWGRAGAAEPRAMAGAAGVVSRQQTLVGQGAGPPCQRVRRLRQRRAG